ncbi:mitochondrial enolase superfamily member 1 [Pseudopipra pipra]|uniref:mitochondrial enolase superfamily member 1 n=1 Tax=Pseudopipra pipra TaxID=415032 RepID=UPI0031398D4E
MGKACYITLPQTRQEQQIVRYVYVSYTRSCSWLGYSDQQLKQFLPLHINFAEKKSVESFTLFDSYFPYPQMLNAKQKWKVKEAIEWVTKPAEFASSSWNMLIWETSGLNFSFFPLHCHNRVIFKQLLQAKALSYLQTDSCSLGRVNENLSALLMAKQFQSKALQNAAAMRKFSSPHPSSHSD